MKHTHDPGLDGLDLTEILILVHDAARAHPTRMPPQDALTDRLRLTKLKHTIAGGGCGGRAEGAPP